MDLTRDHKRFSGTISDVFSITNHATCCSVVVLYDGLGELNDGDMVELGGLSFEVHNVDIRERSCLGVATVPGRLQVSFGCNIETSILRDYKGSMFYSIEYSL